MAVLLPAAEVGAGSNVSISPTSVQPGINRDVSAPFRVLVVGHFTESDSRRVTGQKSVEITAQARR